MIASGLGNHDLTMDAAADEVLAIDDALERLALEDSTAAEVLKLTYCEGLNVEEAATRIVETLIDEGKVRIDGSVPTDKSAAFQGHATARPVPHSDRVSLP